MAGVGNACEAATSLWAMSELFMASAAASACAMRLFASSELCADSCASSASNCALKVVASLIISLVRALSVDVLLVFFSMSCRSIPSWLH